MIIEHIRHHISHTLSCCHDNAFFIVFEFYIKQSFWLKACGLWWMCNMNFVYWTFWIHVQFKMASGYSRIWILILLFAVGISAFQVIVFFPYFFFSIILCAVNAYHSLITLNELMAMVNICKGREKIKLSFALPHPT